MERTGSLLSLPYFLAVLARGVRNNNEPNSNFSSQPATDPNIDPKIRAFLVELNKDTSPFWEQPGPEVRATLTALQSKTPVDMSGATITNRTISEGGQNVKLYIVKPDKVTLASLGKRVST